MLSVNILQGYFFSRIEAEQKRQAEIEKQRKQQEEMEREQEALRKKMIQQKYVCTFFRGKGSPLLFFRVRHFCI